MLLFTVLPQNCRQRVMYKHDIVACNSEAAVNSNKLIEKIKKVLTLYDCL